MATQKLGIAAFSPIAGRGITDFTPACLADAGSLINSPIEPADRYGQDPDPIKAAFAEGAEFADVCRAMIANPNEMWIVVRAPNVPRLAEAAKKLGRKLAPHLIPKAENPAGLYGRIEIAKGHARFDRNAI